MTKVAVVTGSSSGIGYETSLLLARNQFTTYATMRNISKSDGLREIALKENIPINVAQLDVNSDSSVDDAIENIVKENDRIDVLVNNAGYDLFGSLEESSLEKIKEQFETPVFFFLSTSFKARATNKVFCYFDKRQKKSSVLRIAVSGKSDLLYSTVKPRLLR